MTSGRWVRVSYVWPPGHHRQALDPDPAPETMGRREGWARAMSLEAHGAKVTVGEPRPGELFQDVEGRWYRVEDTGAPQRLAMAPRGAQGVRNV